MSNPWLPIAGTGISSAESLRIFYQSINGNINQAEKEGKFWPISYLSPTPVFNSPLASVNMIGNEIDLFYLDNNYVIQQSRYTEATGWYAGDVGKLKVRATPNAGLAVVAYGPLLGGVAAAADAAELTPHIRVFYQGFEKLDIKELAYDAGEWRAGDLNITGALAGTNLAAVNYYFEHQEQIRLYYQYGDLSLREYAHNSSGWFQGEFNSGPSKPTAQTPIGAIAIGAVQLQVYWRDLFGRIVFARNTGSWGESTVIDPIGPGYKFTILASEEDGTQIRLFCQLFDATVVEFNSDDGGNSWYKSDTVVTGVSSG